MLISFAYIVCSEGFLDKPLQPLPNENVNSKDKLTVYLLCSVCAFVIYILRQLCLFICLFLSVCLLLFLAGSVSPPLYTLPRSCLAIGDNTLRIHVPVRVLPAPSVPLQMFFHQAVGGVPLHLSQRAGSCSSGCVPVCSKSSIEPRLKPNPDFRLCQSFLYITMIL